MVYTNIVSVTHLGLANIPGLGGRREGGAGILRRGRESNIATGQRCASRHGQTVIHICKEIKHNTEQVSEVYQKCTTELKA